MGTISHERIRKRPSLDKPIIIPEDPPPQFIEYKAKDGTINWYDISDVACARFGMKWGSRVRTPKGVATVIGVHNSNIWFHIEGDLGASFWDNLKDAGDLKSLGITIIDDLHIINESKILTGEKEDIEMKQGEYRVKTVKHENETVGIMLQNENGPCPLIAVANVLALRKTISMNVTSINTTSLFELLWDRISKDYIHQPIVREKEKEIRNSLETMQYGLDVNFSFTSCDGFDCTDDTLAFKLLSIRLLHGWIPPPTSQVALIMATDTYNDITLQLVTLMESKEDGTETPSPKRLRSEEKGDTQQESKEDEQKREEEQKRGGRQLTREEGVLLSEFLSRTSNQLTDHGIERLQKTMEEGELAVLFRNNHFSTICMHQGQVYSLVTDIGYEKEGEVVWELLSVDGNSQFFSSHFTPHEEIHR